MSRFFGALLRAIIVMMIMALPSVMVPGGTADARQMTALLALFAGALVFVEYQANYPSLIAFRFAPPFNRCRAFLGFALLVISALGVAGRLPALNFGYNLSAMGEIALYALSASLLFVIFFGILLLVMAWPVAGKGFNLWTNLPMFKVVSGRNSLAKLRLSARINLILAVLLSCLPPGVAILLPGSFGFAEDSPLLLVWLVAIWAFVPANLAMRALAMMRLAALGRAEAMANGSGARAYAPV